MHIKGIMVTLITLLLGITSFAQLVPTVYTDKIDYQPGETVIIEGDGWRPGEQVKLEIDHSTITHGNTILYATADDRGHIRNDQFVIQSFHLGESFILTATGMSSGFTATTTFTDANTFTATITPSSINSGATSSFTIRVTNISNGGGSANVRSIEIAMPAGFTGIATTGLTMSANASSAFSFETGAGYTNGYNSSIGTGVIRLKALTGNGLQGNVSPNSPFVDITFTATSPVVASSTVNTFVVRASELNNYTFTSPNNVPIQKITGNDQQPFVTVLACAAPSVTTQPAGQTVTYGNNASFTFQTSTATYQWQESVNGGGSWNNISNGGIYSGVTTNTLNLAEPPVSHNNYKYRCIASFCSPVKTTTSSEVTLTVNKANLTVTADNKNRAYGDANPAFTVNYSGFVSGENASFLTTQPTAASAATVTSGVGDYAIVPSGGVAANYSFSYVNGTLVIGQRAVTVKADAQSKTYGDSDPALTYQVTVGNLVNGDVFSGALARTAGENVGAYAILQGTLALSANYDLTYIGANLTIGKRAVEVTADAQSKTYGDSDPALTYQITDGSLAFSDAFTGGLTRAAGENVGAYAIQQGTLALSGNYDLTYIGANLTIGTRAITVSADAKSKTYGDADPALTYQITDGSLAFSDAFTGALTRAAGENVGAYAIQQGTLALSANYDLTYIGANLTIGKRAVEVTADAKSKTYGDSDPALTYQITDGSLAFSDAFTGGLTRAAGENVGAYAIQQGTLALSANYDLTYIGANLTIGKRAVEVTADAQSKTYGDSDPALTYQITDGSLAFSDAFTGGLTRAAGENVGAFAILQGTLALSANYDLTYIGANLTIGKRAVEVTADAQSKTYGDSDPALTYQITDGSLAFSDAFTGALTRAAGENVGAYAILQGTLALSANYDLTYIGANLTIGKRAVEVTADAQSKTYGDSDPALTYQITDGSLAFSDAFTGALTRAAGENVGAYAILQGTLALSANYDLTYIGANLTIGKRAVEVTADAQSKTYGDSDPALTYQITDGSLAFSDAFTGGLTRATGENVGAYAIQQGILALSANYDLTYIGANLTIGKRAVEVTADAKSKTYGDSDPALTYQITDGSLGFSDAFTGGLTRTAGENVGAFAILQGTLALSANYDLTYIGANLTIGKRAVEVTADAQSKTYGDSDPALTYQITDGSLAFSDAFTGGLTRAAGENVGAFAILQGTLALSANYDLTYIGANLTIGKRAVEVTADAQSKTYGDSDPALTYQITDGSLAFSDAFTGGLTRAAGENVGAYAILQGTLALSANYDLTYIGANLTIGKRAVEVTADAQSKTYGDSDPALTYQITDGSLAFSDAFTGGLTRAAGENVGAYAILQGTLALSANYDLTYIGANLTIGKRAVEVTADAKSKTYGDSDPALTYQITDGSLAFSDAFTGALTRAAGENVGAYAIQQGTLALSANYDLTYIGANLTIGKRAVEVTADPKSKTYGDSDPALTYQITDGSLAFSDAFTGALTRAAGENVGAYAIQQGTLALSANYDLTYIGANLTIGKRAVEVTADAKSKTYGDSDPALTYQITDGSLAFSDAFTGGLTRAAGENVGAYAIQQGTLALSANYDLTYIGANLTIGKRAVEVTADAKSKTYGDSDPALTYQITDGSLAFSDAFTGGLTRAAGENVGAYAIQQGTLALSANYDLTYIGANLTIGKRAVTVTADVQSKTYGDSDPALTYQITDGSLGFSDAFTGGLTRAAGENVGAFAILQGTLALSANYDLTYIGANLTIGKRAVEVTADAQSKTYGDSDPALTYQITDGSLAFSDAFTGALTRAAGENVGAYAILQGTLALSANYDLTYIGANLTIGKRAVEVTADAQSKTYGDSDPALTYQITDGSLAFSDAFTGGLTRAAGENVGVYAIQKGTLALSANYDLTYVGANLTIGTRAITVTADPQSKTYGNADPALTYQITSGNLVFGNTFSGALTRVAGENVGVYAIQKGTLALSANYDLTYIGANLTIGTRAITVTADPQSKTYGNTDPALTYQITSGNLVFGNTFSGALTRVAGENVGVYAIQKGTLALSANYDLTYIGANLTIGTRAITVTADPQSKTYGNADPALTYQITSGNLVFGNTFSGALTRAAGENIGVYAIQQGTLALSANYALTYVGANLTIGKRPLTITVNSKNKLYGAPIPVLDGIETGIVASDNITVSYSTTATQASPIGIYPIAASLNDPDGRLFNYTVTNTPSSLTITVVPVTTYVSTNVTTQQYSDAVTFTATINNGAPVVTGANGAAVSVTFKVGNQVMGTVPLTASGNNLVGVLSDKQLVEGLTGQMAPGSKTVTAIFNTPNANYGLNSYNNTSTSSLMVTKENAEITYTGQDYMSLPSTSATSLTVSLSATIRDLFPAADGQRGNIKNARVTFRRDNPVSGALLGVANIIPALMTDSTTATVVTSFTYTLSSTEQQAGGANLQVYAIADNYYTGGTSDVATTITIARPGAEFVTGGGYLKNTSCAGNIAGTKDLKTNFGFNMQYTKSGSNLKGQCNIIIRSNGKIYQVKSNAVNTLVVSASTSSGTPAYFNTKANYRDITDPLNPISMGGNMDLTVKMNDVSAGGQNDQVSILIMDPNTSQVVFSSNWNGVQTILQTLGGGNVSVRSTPSNTVTMAREAQAEEITMPVVQNPFTVKVFGNPAQDHFNVNIKGSNGKISMRVVDLQGRVVEYRQNVPEGTLQLGHTYQKGFYYLEVRQGNSIRQIKLVKL